MNDINALRDVLSQSGRQCVAYVDQAGNPDRPLALNTYRGKGYTPDRPVVLVQHGVLRNGDDYCDFWMPAADKHGLLIIAPTFSDADWPGLDSYNNGRVTDAEGRVRPVEDWTYAILERLWADVRATGVTQRDRAHLFGHSAGGQFVHRLMSSQSHAPFEAVVASNSGWYTLPDRGLDFPEGLNIAGLSDAHLERLLGYPLLLLLGECDNDVNAPNLPANPEALRQGPHRFARGHNYFAAGKAAAERLGLPFNWQVQNVPHIGHDGRSMSAVAASLWFEGKMPTDEELVRLAGSQVA
ncbi:alpha/beta hydrolase [Schauerella aestuarii]|uniref:alpha/beta hydrolase n=1 Tax=Schauerella aestuarii TaxID=2511204 RepID=UPI00136ABF3A|nr:alpha/beta hydrolase [Achromobacter aestuarii]MYZ45508.1 alpha/beta hydrolase [Achromobacter aestuarii]